ncbi:MAG: NAD-binding protein [Polyangiaceae bacterium]
MKQLTAQLLGVFRKREMRSNLGALAKLLALLLATIAVYSVGFHLLMAWEGQNHTWLTGVYWTLTVMSTLGFGDITFHTDVGRGFSILVLVTGIVLMLIVLPFAFIRFFYAPWLEAQVHLRAPRSAPEDMQDHVVVARYDALAETLIARMADEGVPCLVLEPDPARGVQLLGEGVGVVVGEPDAETTWQAARSAHAALCVANQDDASNTNVVLTIREHMDRVPIVALADKTDSVDILSLSGASHVLLLKQRLGQELASRIDPSRPRYFAVPGSDDLLLSELPMRNARVAGRTFLESELHAYTEVEFVALRRRGRMLPISPGTRLEPESSLMVCGQADALSALQRSVLEEDPRPGPTLVIGGGKVGCAVLEDLLRAKRAAHVIDSDASIAETLRSLATKVVVGDAASLEVMHAAEIESATAVLLTTHDDAVNIYLAVYARRLNPTCRILSRVTHDRNIEAIYRAGADFVLSQSSLGAELVLGLVQGREIAVLGEGADLFTERAPSALTGSVSAARATLQGMGLQLVAIRDAQQSSRAAQTVKSLAAGAELTLLGARDARRRLERMQL